MNRHGQLSHSMKLLDLSVAFDSVDHNTLLQQLSKSYGLGGKVIDWFTSYLNNKKQQVCTMTSSSVPSAVLFWSARKLGPWTDLVSPLH